MGTQAKCPWSLHSQPHQAAAVLWELSHAPQTHFPTATATWEEEGHKRGPHPPLHTVPQPTTIVPTHSLSVLTVALPACSPLSPSYEYSCDGFISPRETLCNDWCSSPRGWEGLHTSTVRVQMPFSGLRVRLEAVDDGDKGSTPP